MILPTVGLPERFQARFAPTKQEAMLAHELAHLAARDPFWFLLADLAAAFLWWHPAVWWLRRQFQLVSEMAADDASALVAEGPRGLAECLVELGSHLTSPRLRAALPAAGFSSHLGRRVERLLNHNPPAWSRPHRVRAALVKGLGPAALAAAVILCTAWTAPQALMERDVMKTIQLNWKQTFAALAVATSLGPPTSLANPPDPQSSPPGTSLAGASSDEINSLKRQLAEKTTRGLMPAASVADAAPSGLLETKLKKIVLESVHYDGVPLGEVLRSLSEEALKRDPSKTGVNFLINPNSPPSQNASVPGPIDPTTGLPVLAAVENVDMSSVSIRFNLPLRNVSLKDVLNAIVKVADRPIEYTVEDYAVVFSPKALPGGTSFAPVPLLAVRTFQMNTNTFIPGLKSTFGIEVSGVTPRRVQDALRLLLLQLGVTMDHGKSVFYNEITGVVMVRATPDELNLIAAAMETLGGTAEDGRGTAGKPGGQ
jgi:hypothetical protein